ncbi:hypothetical protein Q5752_001924 [Cryptotrichosporon argae]
MTSAVPSPSAHRTPRAPLGARKTVPALPPAPSTPDDFVARHAVEFAHLHIGVGGAEPAEAMSARLRAQECALEEARRVGRERKRMSMGIGVGNSNGNGMALGPPLGQVGSSDMQRTGSGSGSGSGSVSGGGGASRVRPLSLVGKSPSLQKMEHRVGEGGYEKRRAGSHGTRARPLSLANSHSASDLGGDESSRTGPHEPEEVLASRPTTMSSISTADLDGSQPLTPASRSSVRYSLSSSTPHSRPSLSSAAAPSLPSRPTHRSGLSTYSWQTDFSGTPADLRLAAHYALPLDGDAGAEPAADPAPALSTPERRDRRRRQVKAMAQTVRVLEGASSRAAPLGDAMRARILRGYQAHFTGGDDDEADETLLPPAELDPDAAAAAASPALSDVRTPDTPGIATFASMQRGARDTLSSHASSADSELVMQGARLMADAAWMRPSADARASCASRPAAGPTWAARPAPWAHEGETPPFEYDDAVTVSAWWRSAAEFANSDDDEDDAKVAGTPRLPRTSRASVGPGGSGGSGLAGLGLGFGRGEDGAGPQRPPSPPTTTATTGSRRSRGAGDPDPRELLSEASAVPVAGSTGVPRPSPRAQAPGGLASFTDPRAAASTPTPQAHPPEHNRPAPRLAAPRAAPAAAPLRSPRAAPASPPSPPSTSAAQTANPPTPPRLRHPAGPLPLLALGVLSPLSPLAARASASPSSPRSRPAFSSSPSPSPPRRPAPRPPAASSAFSATCSAPSTPGRPSAAPRERDADEQAWPDEADTMASPRSSSPTSQRRPGSSPCSSRGSSHRVTEPDADATSGLALPFPFTPSPSIQSPSVIPLDKLRPVPPKRSQTFHPFSTPGLHATLQPAPPARTTFVPLSPATMFALGFACPLLWAVGAWPRRPGPWVWRHHDPWVMRCRYAAAVAYALVIPGLVVGIVVVATR